MPGVSLPPSSLCLDYPFSSYFVIFILDSFIPPFKKVLLPFEANLGLFDDNNNIHAVFVCVIVGSGSEKGSRVWC